MLTIGRAEVLETGDQLRTATELVAVEGDLLAADEVVAAIGTFLRPGRAVTPGVGQRVVLMNEAGALCVVTIDAVQSEINNATYTPASVTFAYEILAGR